MTPSAAGANPPSSIPGAGKDRDPAAHRVTELDQQHPERRDGEAGDLHWAQRERMLTRLCGQYVVTYLESFRQPG